MQERREQMEREISMILEGGELRKGYRWDHEVETVVIQAS